MELVTPDIKYYPSYLDAVEEYRAHHVHTYDFLEPGEYDVFEQIENYRTGNHLPDGYVKAIYLWLADGGRFIGEIAVRHSLTPSLMRFGGNIGYGVRYSEWNKGYGALMLSKALKYAKEVIGLEKALITCNDDNFASARVIEKNGGKLQDKIVNTVDGDDRLTRRYWIAL